MLKTEPELYEVTGAQNNHLWLEILEGPDQGIRVSVPVHSSRYNRDLQEDILQFEVGNVYELSLVSERESPPDWRVEEIHDELEPRRRRRKLA